MHMAVHPEEIEVRRRPNHHPPPPHPFFARSMKKNTYTFQQAYIFETRVQLFEKLVCGTPEKRRNTIQNRQRGQNHSKSSGLRSRQSNCIFPGTLVTSPSSIKLSTSRLTPRKVTSSGSSSSHVKSTCWTGL